MASHTTSPGAFPETNKSGDKRIQIVEISMVIAGLVIFYAVTDYKDIGYAVGLLAGIGILVWSFFKPRWGLVAILGLLFTECTVNLLNTLAQAAEENDLSGVPMLVNTQWFALGVLILYAVFYTAYVCREFVLGNKLKPLSTIELVLLLPFAAVLTYFPISMLYGHEFLLYSMDIIPMCIYAGIVPLIRVFGAEKNSTEIRYWLLDWFLILNLVILVPIWAFILIFSLFRDAFVGITAIRYSMGPYDFNFFLVPILGMILTYDDNLSARRKKFYQFNFVLCIARVIVSLFRGPMAGTFIAIILASLLVDSRRRGKWLKSLLTLSAMVFLIGGVLVATVPPIRAVFNVGLVNRLQQAINRGAGSSSLQFRYLESEKALNDIMEEPLVGYGPGALITKNFKIDKNAQVELYLHSGYIWFWYKLGLLGIIVVIVFVGGIFATCIQLLRRTLHPPDRGWVIGTLAATIAMLPVIHTNNMLIRSQGAYAMTLLLFGLGLIYAKYRDVPKNELPDTGGGVAE
jgi:hypothetical protein